MRFVSHCSLIARQRLLVDGCEFFALPNPNQNSDGCTSALFTQREPLQQTAVGHKLGGGRAALDLMKQLGGLNVDLMYLYEFGPVSNQRGKRQRKGPVLDSDT